MKKTRYDELLEHAEKFHNEHPEVAEKFDEIVLELMRCGHKHYSALGVVHIIRWTTRAGADGVSRFKINDHYAPFYARGFMAKHPEHDGFFRLRNQSSKSRPATHLQELGPADFNDDEKEEE